MTSHAKPVNNPFRRMVQDYKEEEVIDIDENNEDQADYGNYDYSQNDYEPTQRSQGFTMSENRANAKPK